MLLVDFPLDFPLPICALDNPRRLDCSAPPRCHHFVACGSCGLPPSPASTVASSSSKSESVLSLFDEPDCSFVLSIRFPDGFSVLGIRLSSMSIVASDISCGTLHALCSSSRLSLQYHLSAVGFCATRRHVSHLSHATQLLDMVASEWDVKCGVPFGNSEQRNWVRPAKELQKYYCCAHIALAPTAVWLLQRHCECVESIRLVRQAARGV